MVNLGTATINFTMKIVHQTLNIAQGSVVCIVAPFKDDKFKFKYYNTIAQAISEQKTENENALGVKYLQILNKLLGDNTPVALCNITTNSGTEETPEYNYNFTSEKIADAYLNLERADFEILAIPYELSDTDLDTYKGFFETKSKALGLPGLMFPRNALGDKPYNSIPDKFPKGGVYKVITGSSKFTDGTEYNILESVIYHAALTSLCPVDESETEKIIDGLVGVNTRETCTPTRFEEITNNGAIAIDILMNNNTKVGIVNANTPSMVDLSILRTFNSIMKDIRNKLKFGEKTKLTLQKVLEAVNSVGITAVDTGKAEDVKLDVYRKEKDDNGNPRTNLMGGDIIVKIGDITFGYDISAILEVV
nr:hypothetical protein [Methanobrevibacter arboriphilus]